MIFGGSMKVYAVLHGQTELDIEKRIQGIGDEPLCDKGREQADTLAGALSEKGIDMIISSQQLRTRETADIIADKLGLDKSKIVNGMKFIERCYGEHEGVLKDEIDLFAIYSWSRNEAVVDGETIRELAERVILYINNMVRLFRAKTMLLVVPNNVLDVLFWYFNGLPDAGQEKVPDYEHDVIYEFETDDIPAEMKDFMAVLDRIKAEETGESGSSSKLLSQNEIDALIAQMTGG